MNSGNREEERVGRIGGIAIVKFKNSARGYKGKSPVGHQHFETVATTIDYRDSQSLIPCVVLKTIELNGVS